MTSRHPIVVFGAGGHALVVADIIKRMGQHHIVGFLDDINPQRYSAKFAGASILGGSNKLKDLRSDGVSLAIVAIGDCSARAKVADKLIIKGFSLVSCSSGMRFS